MRKSSGFTGYGWMMGALLLAMAGCNGSGGDSNANTSRPDGNQANRITRICPGPEATSRALKAMFEAGQGDVIEFCEGDFEFSTGLVLASTQGVTIRGAGLGKTVLSFADSNSKEGLLISNVKGVTVEDLTVLDMPGDGIKVTESQYITLRRVEAAWSDADPSTPEYDPDTSNGTYSIYPVLSKDVLVEDSVARGSSDVGFYIGQSERVIVRNNRAVYNVQGYEFENTRDSEMYGNLAENNAGGFLVVDLPGRAIFGARNRIHDNTIINNNTRNFAPAGTIASNVPRGTGIIVLATDQVEIFDNEIRDNDSLGIITLAYPLIDRSQDARYDYFPEGIHIHDNVFADNGKNPETPDPESGNGSGLVSGLILQKNQGESAQIAWDGLVDEANPGCAYPDGVPEDERGEPQYGPDDSAPDCGDEANGDPVRYNAYKFDDNGALITPENSLCIQNNRFEGTQPVTPEFVNFHGTESVPATRDKSAHDCSLPSYSATELQTFNPDANAGNEKPSEAEVKRLCKGGEDGQINRDAIPVDCPRLTDYGLFTDPDNPLSKARGNGTPYSLNTKLFSDYALKHRVIFLPPGQPAQWRDHTDGPNAHLDFPVGTVIAKTFYFEDDDTQDIVETRLLIKRKTDNGVYWQGLPFLWQTDAETGERFAGLKVDGAIVSASWDYLDPNPDARNMSGKRPRYTGSTDSYTVPHANQCVACHRRENLEPGAAPIGPKVRMINRSYDYGGQIGEMNQLQYMCTQGLLVDCPADLEQVEKQAVWNVPGSSGELPGTDADVEARARAYVESNCSHCHNPEGAAKNTRLSLDQWIATETDVIPRPVDRAFGICKPSVAAGRGTGNREYDIKPGHPEDSILEFRVENAGDKAIQMPPIARSVTHTEGHALLEEWISRLPLPTTKDDFCSRANGMPSEASS